VSDRIDWERRESRLAWDRDTDFDRENAREEARNNEIEERRYGRG